MDTESNLLPRVLIVEDDEYVRLYFETSIHQHDQLSLCGSVGCYHDAMEQIRSAPDVMLVDLGLPDGNGADLIRHLKMVSPQSEAIVITVFADEFRVIEAIRAGATGYLLKDSMPNDIGDLIMEMLAGDAPISSSIARYLLKALNSDPAAVAGEGGGSLLSVRETEVLYLVARGYKREEIALHMGVSVHTVVAHNRNIYKKLSVHSSSEAVFEAYHLGLIKLDG